VCASCTEKPPADCANAPAQRDIEQNVGARLSAISIADTIRRSEYVPPTARLSSRPVGWRFALIAAVALGVFFLCAGVLIAASNASSAKPDVSVEAERTMQGAKLSIRGRGWPPRTSVTLSATKPPGADADLDLGTTQTNAEGEFRATKLSKCTTRNESDGSASVTIAARAGEVRAEQSITAVSWVCMSAM
jgi:hypothetical protein